MSFTNNQITDGQSEISYSEEHRSDMNLSGPPSHFLPQDYKLNKTEHLIDKLIRNLTEIDNLLQRKIELIERIDLTIQITDYKMFEITHEFRSQIKHMQNERDQLLTTVDNKSELSFILNNLDKKILDLEQELHMKIKNDKLEKLELQNKAEAISFQLEDDFSMMKTRMQELKDELEGIKNTMYKAQFMILNQQYAPKVDEIEKRLADYEKLQNTGWRVEYADVKLSKLLQENGLQITASGKLLTNTGSTITFQQAQDRGFFNDVRIPFDRIVQFFKERDEHQNVIDQLHTADTSSCTESSTIDLKMPTEDVLYLKQYLGKPLTLALAEIVSKQPRDPIHYLGHYLFKYRYNQELEYIDKKNIEELTTERQIRAEQRWKEFLESEAKNAVIDMVLRAEREAYENELKRIEQEQMTEEKEENDLETDEILQEARDKFE